MKRTFFAILYCILLSNLASCQTNILLEAENALLTGTNVTVDCASASGGRMVKDIANGVANALTFNNIDIPTTETYFITVGYFSKGGGNMTWKINDQDAVTQTLSPSGDWCFEGGRPANFTFEVIFNAGTNTLIITNAPIIDKVLISSDNGDRSRKTFYISSSEGSDSNNGSSKDKALKTLNQVNGISLIPGDSLLFKSGDTFTGQLIIMDESGEENKSIVISSYGNGAKPIIDGDGYLSAVQIQNSGYLQMSNLEIKNDGGPSKPGVSENLRYGISLENTHTDGTKFDHYRFDGLVFNNIYSTTQITDNDQSGVNSYGFRSTGSFNDDINPTRFDDLIIENCLFTRMGRHALFVAAMNNLIIRNNLFEHTGGAGIVLLKNVTNALVEHNVTNFTGSNIDSRMAARGSGFWCFRTTNLVVQHNEFKHARGVKDSHGMHIDIGNRNVVFQYNYSEDNEGGFAEILGANRNVGYRYNMSIGDGWRSRPPQLGRVFWVGGWSGTVNQPAASDSVFIYNNSLYVKEDIAPRIWLEDVTQNTKIQNNIVYVAKDFSDVFIKNDESYNDIDHNIWYGNISTTDTDGEDYRGPNALTSDPMFMSAIVEDANGFVLQASSPAIKAGKLIYNPNDDSYFSSHGGYDYFGNPVSTTEAPNIGAYNLSDRTVSNREIEQLHFKIYPNNLKSGDRVNITIPDNVTIQSIAIQLIDTTGRILVKKFVPNQHHIQLETIGLTHGTYFVKIISEKGQVTKKIMVF